MKYIWTYENNITKEGGGNGDVLEQNAYVLWEFGYSEIDCGKLRYIL